MQGTTTITNPSGDGIAITNSPANFNFQGTTTIDNAGVNGIDLTGSNGTVTFSSIDLDTIGSVGLNVQNNTSEVTVNGGSIGATNDPGGNARRHPGRDGGDLDSCDGHEDDGRESGRGDGTFHQHGHLLEHPDLQQQLSRTQRQQQ